MDERSVLLEEFLDSIKEPVIVEGLKDKQALEAFGVKDVIQLNRGESILSVVESIQGEKRAVILTDLDKEGKVLRKKILRYFGLYGIYENKRPREILAQMRISHVEGLKQLIEEM